MKASFFIYAVDETDTWTYLPDACTKVFGLYLIREGEATHLCSLQPSSRADFTENVFVGLDYDVDEQQDWMDTHAFENAGIETSYFPFITHEQAGDRASEMREFETDEEDPERAIEDLWDQAREDFSANHSAPAVVGGAR